VVSAPDRRGRDAATAAGYRLLFEQAVEPILLSDGRARTLDANRRACEMFGYTREEMASLDRPLIIDVADERLGPLMEERELKGWAEGDLRMVRRGGKMFEAHVWAALIEDEDGELRGWMGVRDLTPEIEARAALAEAKAILEAQFDGSPDGILVMDSGGNIIQANRRFFEISGLPESWAARPVLERRTALVRMVERPDEMLEFVAACDANPNEALSATFRLADGRVCETRTLPLALRGGAERGRIYTYSDVTAKELLAAKLRESEELQRTIVSSLAEGVVLFLSDGTVGASNEAAWQILGRTPEEFVSANRRDAQSPLVGEDGTVLDPERNPVTRGFRSGEPANNALVGVYRPDGSLRWLLVNTRVLRGEGTGPWGVVASFLDVTERRAMETSLAQARHTESLAQLAGGVAHKLNNQLTAIIGNSWIAGMADELPAEIRAALDEIATAAVEAGELVQDLLRFSSAQARRESVIHLNDCAWAALGTLAPEKQARTDIHPATGLPTVRGDMESLRVALVSLIENALEADEGSVLVATGGFRLDGPQAGAVYAPAPPHRGCWLYLEVRDRGAGIEEENLQRVFDPFFSTRFTGRGLGLPGAVAVARDHGGCIEILSTPGQGTRARIMLPLDLSNEDCAISEG